MFPSSNKLHLICLNRTNLCNIMRLGIEVINQQSTLPAPPPSVPLQIYPCPTLTRKSSCTSEFRAWQRGLTERITEPKNYDIQTSWCWDQKNNSYFRDLVWPVPSCLLGLTKRFQIGGTWVFMEWVEAWTNVIDLFSQASMWTLNWTLNWHLQECNRLF